LSNFAIFIKPHGKVSKSFEECCLELTTVSARLYSLLWMAGESASVYNRAPTICNFA